MAMWARLRSLTSVLSKRDREQFEDDMAEELQCHVELRADELRAAGLSEAGALRRARMELGPVDAVRSDMREARGLRLVDELRQDLRYAARGLRKTPGFTAAALLTLGLCLGANLTIFAVVDAVLLRALPLPDAERLVGLYNTYPRANVLDDGSSVTNYYERRGKIAALASLALYREGSAAVGDVGSAERVAVTFVTAEFFATLGVAPARGVVDVGVSDSSLSADATVTGPVAVTYNYWQTQLRGEANVVGNTLRVDGVPRTIAGVLPATFSFLSSEAQLYLPLTSRASDRLPSRRHSNRSTRMVARLAAGATVVDAQAQIDAHNAVMEQSNPQAAMMAEAGFRSLVVPLRAHHVASVRPTLVLLQVGALVLLLIGGVNLVNLFLVRASGRLKEMAVRHALGVTRHRIISQVLVETTLLTLVGGLLGLAGGAVGIQALSVLGTERLPLGAHVVFDTRLALVALAGAVVVGLAIGAPIAWYHLRSHAQISAQFEGRGSVGGRAAERLRQGFAVAQTALAFVLLSSAGLLGLSLEHTMAVSPGFAPGGVGSGRVALPRAAYPDGPALLAFTDRLLDALAGQPGIAAAGIGTNVPFSGITTKSAVTASGAAQSGNASPRGHYAYAVTGRYFEALGIPLHAGRFIDADDSRRDTCRCVVDDDFARDYWPAGTALGQHVFLGSERQPGDAGCTVVGIVGAVKQAGLIEDDAPGAIFLPYLHNADRQVFVVARGSAPAALTAARLASVVRDIDPDLPTDDARSMQQRIDGSLVARRSPALLAAIFSTIAVLLTAVGIYGLLSYAVSQRRREIGLRMALGARPAQVRQRFLMTAIGLLASGGGLGLAGAWAAGRAMQAVLYEVPETSPLVLAGAAVLLTVVSLAACLLPTWRASRISPMEALNDA